MGIGVWIKDELDCVRSKYCETFESGKVEDDFATTPSCSLSLRGFERDESDDKNVPEEEEVEESDEDEEEEDEDDIGFGMAGIGAVRISLGTSKRGCLLLIINKNNQKGNAQKEL